MMAHHQINIKRFIPLFILLVGLILFFSFRLYRYLTFDQLQKQHNFLKQWTSQNYVLAVLSYIFIYILAVAISIPGAVILTITGGFLFGVIFGSIYTVIAATIGATILFLAVKTALGSWIAKKTTQWITKMRNGFQKNAFNYLLFLRFVPLFPFWVVNIVPALFNMRLISFVIATFIGIIPGTVVYAGLGNGLEKLIASGKTPELNIIFKPEILLPLLGLAILSLLPILYKKLKHDKS
jgi:uncharacterized membrane protein YdjX (TVP38/TMEM64 family)